MIRGCLQHGQWSSLCSRLSRVSLRPIRSVPHNIYQIIYEYSKFCLPLGIPVLSPVFHEAPDEIDHLTTKVYERLGFRCALRYLSQKVRSRRTEFSPNSSRFSTATSPAARRPTTTRQLHFSRRRLTAHRQIASCTLDLHHLFQVVARAHATREYFIEHFMEHAPGRLALKYNWVFTLGLQHVLFRQPRSIG